MVPATVRVHVPMPLRSCCGGAAELQVAAHSVREVLGEIERRHPSLHRGLCDDTGAVRRHIGVFVNREHVRDCGGIDAALAPGDLVLFLPAVSGG